MATTKTDHEAVVQCKEDKEACLKLSLRLGLRAQLSDIRTSVTPIHLFTNLELPYCGSTSASTLDISTLMYYGILFLPSSGPG